MEDLLKIVVVFENCDSISLHKEVLHGFTASDITESYILVANALIHSRKISKSYLAIKKNLVKFATTEFNSNLLERLEKYKDITHYHLYLTDGTQINLSLPWSDDDYTNSLEVHAGDKEILKIYHENTTRCN